MSKKKIFTLICLLIFISWGILSAYYYKQHIVTIKEHKIGEIVEVSEGIVMLHNIEIHDFERNHHFFFDELDWFFDSVLPKIPKKLHETAMKIVVFYSKPYDFQLGFNGVGANKIYVKGIYISNDGPVEDQLDKINITAFTEDGIPLNTGAESSQGTVGSNIRQLNFEGRFFLDQYSPKNGDDLTITVADKITDEAEDINIKTNWETKKYNFFNQPPGEYSYSPENAVRGFLRSVIYEEDLRVAKEMIHPEISDFPWENLKHDQWSRGYENVILYKRNYLGFNDVFLSKITFGETEEIFEQKIYLINHNGQWKIIDASPLS